MLQMTAELEVLVVEDDEAVSRFLARTLEREGFAVVTAAGGREALALVRDRHFDLIVLDLMLPDVDGLDVLSELREGSGVPTIIVSGRGDEADLVLGLRSGADDYVVKPFSPRELAARVHAVLRRATMAAGAPSHLRFGDLEVDVEGRVVRIDGERVTLTRQEFDLLVAMATRPGRACTREELLEWAWGSSSDFQDPATVTEHVRRLRQKLDQSPGARVHIATVRGVGYRFDP
jgi:DNA-binding response OmpR family regulator